jgi:hypothetical protein
MSFYFCFDGAEVFPLVYKFCFDGAEVFPLVFKVCFDGAEVFPLVFKYTGLALIILIKLYSLVP